MQSKLKQLLTNMLKDIYYVFLQINSSSPWAINNYFTISIPCPLVSLVLPGILKTTILKFQQDTSIVRHCLRQPTSILKQRHVMQTIGELPQHVLRIDIPFLHSTGGTFTEEEKHTDHYVLAMSKMVANNEVVFELASRLNPYKQPTS